MEIYEDQESLE